MHMTHANDAALTRSERDLEALATVGRRLRGGADLDHQLSLTLRLAAEAVGANRASVMLLNPQTERLEIRCSVGLPPEAILSTIGLGEGIAGWVAEHNQPFILHGPVTDPRFEGVDPTIDSSLCLPLAADSRVMGVLNLTRQPGDPFTVEDLRLASALADLASVAVEKALLYASLRERETRVARLLEAAMNAQETERRRIGDEMHEGLVRDLTGQFQREIEKITAGCTAPPEALAVVEQIQDAIRRTSAELRDHVFKVCPPSLDERGLAPSLATMVDGVCTTSSVEGHFENRVGDERLPSGVESILYRVAQEALRSVVERAGAREVWVALGRNRTEAEVSVRGDGQRLNGGVEPGPSADRRPGTTGLEAMRERLALAGGAVEVVAVPEGGTRISARIPLAAFR
jgi:signal transduction histidine kinase